MDRRPDLSMHGNPIEDLANAIVYTAAIDYREALRGYYINNKSPETILRDVERFVESEWYGLLTTVDGKAILEKLRKEYEDEYNSYTADT